MSSSQTQFAEYNLAEELVVFPELASGTAIKNTAKRFATAYGLPEGAAFAFSAASVDPAAERTKIGTKDPTEHLNMIQTPSGRYLACHPVRVWTSLISGDGSNGRSRYDIQTSGSNGTRSRPWPIGRHHRPAIIDYHTSAFDDMVTAARKSAEMIRSPQLVTQIARNPRGVWNPPVVVLARAFIRHDDGTHEEQWFLHTIEGSTRVEACHELAGTDPGAPLTRSDEPLEHLRESNQQLVEKFNTLPTSPKSLAAARAATMPALVVVAVVDEEGSPISTGFPDVVNDYVESVHVQPRPFNDVAQSNVLGERFLLTMRREGTMSEGDVDALLGRDHTIPGKPSVRAAGLVHAVCDSSKEKYVRDIVITEDRARLTKGKRASLVGPLVVRQFEKAAETADRALMRPFTPDPLIEIEWEPKGEDSEMLRQLSLAEHEANDWGQATLELMARGGPALCAAGLLLSDQGSTVKGISELRGNVDKVVEGMAMSAGGINVLADAVGWADGERLEKPRMFKVDGSLIVVRSGESADVKHYDDSSWERGNMEIRALALTNGVIPEESNADQETTETKEDPTPEQLYQVAEEGLLAALVRADTHLRDLVSMKDEQGRRLISRLRMRRTDLYTSFPALLAKTYGRFGDDDPFEEFDEDRMPDDAAGGTHPTADPYDEVEDDE